MTTPTPAQCPACRRPAPPPGECCDHCNITPTLAAHMRDVESKRIKAEQKRLNRRERPALDGQAPPPSGMPRRRST